MDGLGSSMAGGCHSDESHDGRVSWCWRRRLVPYGTTVVPSGTVVWWTPSGVCCKGYRSSGPTAAPWCGPRFAVGQMLPRPYICKGGYFFAGWRKGAKRWACVGVRCVTARAVARDGSWRPDGDGVISAVRWMMWATLAVLRRLGAGWQRSGAQALLWCDSRGARGPRRQQEYK